MSGPTWLPPKQVGIPGQPGITVSAPTVCKPQKSFASVPALPKPLYGSQEANGTMNSTGASPRYQPQVPGPSSFLQDPSPEHHYSPADESWAGVSHTGYPLQNFESTPYPPAHSQPSGAKPTSAYKPVPTFSPAKSSAFTANNNSYAKNVPYGSNQPSQPPSYPAVPSSYITSIPGDAYSANYHRATGVPKPYPQPIPASYATASSPAGPPVNIQVKVAQPVLGYNQPRRRPEVAYGPPSPRPGYGTKPPPQYTSEPGVRTRSHEVEPWYPEPPSYGRRLGEGEFYHGLGGHPRMGAPQPGPYQTGLGKPVKEELAVASQMPSSGGGMRYQHQVPPSRPEEELDRLTKKLVYDMNNPPSGEYFGRCSQCGENVVGDGTGCVAMDQVFHVECFTCATCRCRLRGQPFYAIDRRSYCESCYIVTLEKCSMCSKPIMDRILRAMGKAYHPQCFTCVVCHRCLDGVPFTVDATSQIHCIEDFHRKFAPRCSVCGNAIMPEPGQEETVRIVALDRSFHIGCYKCEECGLLLSSEGEGRGCYPLDGHILCKSCSAQRIQELSSKITTDC
ncbi:thyroid receptor-interacting protein 6 isoform X2 [Sceloporus undulatus]|uniref:thyroid receptor-interacting protein 6 isoform X2 n=1 Tax=Sceloporus undulatus TaxID=8520 RepID=UPI001C4B3BA1|nr:thyroid receptor-interacting protein 6 isoform X2 [Sceloporus undulatus]